ELMITNKAIARGAYEAGVSVLSAYPGTPSTEIAENFVKHEGVYAEWAPNEKVAVEVAIGAAVAGARSMACMKHVGLNVAADPLFTVAYTGINAGLVIVVADDPGMHSSQNEQDSRFYARSAHVPMLEPSDANEAKEFVKLAYELSEKFDTPVLVRETTRVAHSHGLVELCERNEVGVRPYEKSAAKYVMMPANAIKRHVTVEARDKAIAEYVNGLEINRAEYTVENEIGVVCSGVVYEYVKEALPNANVFKIGSVHPVPVPAILEFSKKVKELFVIEELEPFIEDTLKAAGIACKGKEIFSLQGEISVKTIREKFGLESAEVAQPAQVPARPPVMCAGCPHRGVFYVLNKLKLTVNGDIGCYTLGAVPPLAAVDTCVCMGASVGMAHGFKKATGGASKNVAVIGDSTFLHSGVTGLINAVYNQSGITLMILDNSTTGMTGHQQHPATGKNLKGEPAPVVLLDELCKACGVKDLQIVDAYDVKGVEKAVKSAILSDEVSVIIAQRPCALLDKSPKPKMLVDGCKNCGVCMKLGCPAISRTEKGIQIDPMQCTGCGVCANVCPFGALKKEGN
ncbi:MAG: indolepyruvate ferredoxin oxidoreductase subunit alpha, partial [Clostridia bacterium]|nr:indolepyruvate ferredoxin oxidoreductase subunit alpha [Clostridia bacterium]